MGESVGVQLLGCQLLGLRVQPQGWEGKLPRPMIDCGPCLSPATSAGAHQLPRQPPSCRAGCELCSGTCLVGTGATIFFDGGARSHHPIPPHPRESARARFESAHDFGAGRPPPATGAAAPIESGAGCEPAIRAAYAMILLAWRTYVMHMHHVHELASHLRTRCGRRRLAQALARWAEVCLAGNEVGPS